VSDNGIDLPDRESYPPLKIGKRTIDVKSLLTIDPENLVYDYQTIHHWIATVSYRIGLMQITIAKLKRNLQRMEASLCRSTRATHEKRPTEAMLKGFVVLDQGYQKLQDDIDDKEFVKASYGIVLTALENKRELVVNMGAELRKKGRHNLTGM